MTLVRIWRLEEVTEEEGREGVTRQWRNQEWGDQGVEKIKQTISLVSSPLIISSLTALIQALIPSAQFFFSDQSFLRSERVCVLTLEAPKNSDQTGSVQINPSGLVLKGRAVWGPVRGADHRSHGVCHRHQVTEVKESRPLAPSPKEGL